MRNIIDLFAGAGGLSLGAARAGFNICAAVELDEFAIDTHIRNFPKTIHSNYDILELNGEKLLEIANLKMGELDGLIGGPPCQGFSLIGQRRTDDTRNNLFQHFFRLVNETRPKFFLAENVPGILDGRFADLRSKSFDVVRNNYILLDGIKVRASDYGVPTTRTRIFFIGYDPLYMDRLTPKNFEPDPGTKPVFVKSALDGLPIEIDPNWLSEANGWRPIEKKGEGKFFDCITNHIPNGVGNPFCMERYFKHSEVSGCMGTRHSKAVEERYQSLAYGQQDKTSKSVRLDPDGFCPTLRAGTARDKGSYQSVRPIHPFRPRVITPREAARLQGFPDWFVFQPTKWHSFRQIGNSVSPIVSEQLLSVLFNKL